MLGPAAERLHHLPLARDAVGGGAVLGHRVAPPRFGKAALELGARAVEEQGLDVAAAAFAQFLDPPHEQRGAETAAAAIDADGERAPRLAGFDGRSEEHTSELQSLMRISYAVFC